MNDYNKNGSHPNNNNDKRTPPKDTEVKPDNQRPVEKPVPPQSK
jgi:hypothetical protein